MSVRRIPDSAPVEHPWTGNEDTNRQHHVILRVPRAPMTLGLHWQTPTEKNPYFIGNFSIDLLQLIAEGYARWENEAANQARLRIDHSEDGPIRIATSHTDKGLLIGWLRE